MECYSDLLQGKVTLITGCNRGIGLSILKRFIDNAGTVYACARTQGCLDAIIKEFPNEKQKRIIPCYFDVNDSSAVKKTFVLINRKSGRLDCLVNNAGIMQDALIGMVSKKLMRDLFETNVFAMVDLMQYAVKLMSRQKSGSIINISSIVGVNGNPGQIAYSATKGAVISLTKTAAKELAASFIRVNSIAPGIIDTDMLASIGAKKVEEIKSKIGMRRLGRPDDIADAALFLASDLSAYITGQIIGVDGSTIL